MFQTTWSSLRRMGYIVLVLMRHAALYAGSRWLARWPVVGRRLAPFRLNGPDRLRTILEDLGGTFIKFGQMMALQPDVLPFAYCNALFDLMDRVAPFEFDKVRNLFIDELGRPPSDIFDTFDERPIATASIGQVHTATLNGQRLVVKVQRPNVDTDFMGDIRLMGVAIRLIKRLRWTALYWLIEPISEFVNWTQEELDYRHEARYMDQLRRNATENPDERVPVVYWPYTTRRILTTEYFEGITVLDYLRALESGDQKVVDRLRDMDFEPNQFARHIIDNFLGDAFRYGLFHADLHPANLIVLHGNTIGYVDFGITGMLSHYSRRELVSLTLAYTRADLDGMCLSFLKVSSMDADSDIAGFRQGLQRYADEWYEARGDRKRLRKNFTLVMVDMLRLSKQTGIWPERDVIKYIRSSIAIDGLITRFAPGFDVGDYLATTCARYLREARQPFLSPSILVDWSFSSSRLIRDGSYQMVSLLHRLSSLEAGSTDRDDTKAAGPRAAYLGGMLLVLSGVMLATDEPVRLGLNLFTAEAGLFALAGILLLHTVYRGA
jgi:ubiquinone biosynthesis protein